MNPESRTLIINFFTIGLRSYWFLGFKFFPNKVSISGSRSGRISASAGFIGSKNTGCHLDTHLAVSNEKSAIDAGFELEKYSGGTACPIGGRAIACHLRTINFLAIVCLSVVICM
jgi:hypothetical protein